MVDWKKATAGISVPIIVYSFTYFNLFGMPYFPSLWQLTFFFTNVFSRYFEMFLGAAVLVYAYINSKNFLAQKSTLTQKFNSGFKIGLLLVGSFIIGISLSDIQRAKEILFDLNNLLLVALYCFSIAAFAIGIIYFDVQTNMAKKTIAATIYFLLFVFISKEFIVRFMDFPRESDYKFRIWSSESADYIYSCKNPKGSLYETRYEKNKDGRYFDTIYLERRAFSTDKLEKLCDRLFSE